MVLNYLHKYVGYYLRKNQLFVITNFQDGPGRSSKQLNTLYYTPKEALSFHLSFHQFFISYAKYFYQYSLIMLIGRLSAATTNGTRNSN